MLIYADTGVLAALYLGEPDSASIGHLLGGAEVVASSRIAYAEMCAALSAADRAGRFPEGGHARARHAFKRDWMRVLAIEVSQEVVEAAGGLANACALRGYDAVHLASALCLAS